MKIKQQAFYKRFRRVLVTVWWVSLVMVALSGGGVAAGYGVWRLTQDQHIICPGDELINQDEVVDEHFLSREMPAPEDSDITVDISGAVVKPGLYQVKGDTRLGEVVELAGGFSQLADKTRVAQDVNLAQYVQNEQKIYIPLEGEEFQVGQDKKAIQDQYEDTGSDGVNKISVNTASKKELMSLKGIGEVRAEEIMSSRPYSSIEELVSKEVLSEAVFDGISELLIL